MSIRPMNVTFRPKSRYRQSFLSAPDAIAPGVTPQPAHDLVFRGGRTIPKLAYRNVYVAPTHWDPADMDRIDASLAAAMSDARLNGVMQQYFKGMAIEAAFLGRSVVNGKQPHLVTQASVEKLIRRLFAAGKLATADLSSTVFDVLLPPGTILRDDDTPGNAQDRPDVPAEDEASSLEGLGGYHGSVHVATSGGRQTIYYAVGVFSQILADGAENGIVAFDAPWKNVVATFYHELNEARTDPDVEDVIRGELPEAALGWTSAQGEECGDFPVEEVGSQLGKVFVEVPLVAGGTAPVQLQYSNKDHGPSAGP